MNDRYRPDDAPGEVTITHRSAGYALGRGPDFYGVFRADAEVALLERFPRDASGWFQAWGRFNTLASGEGERMPAVTHAAPTTGHPLLAIGLLLGGIGLGIASLFPAYLPGSTSGSSLSGSALVDQGDQLAQHVFFLVVWALVIGLLALGGTARRVGAALGLGFSAMTFGFFLSDLSQVATNGAHVTGAGLILGLLGWLACTEGCVTAYLAIRRQHPFGRPRGRRWAAVLLVGVLAIGVAVAFAPTWDNFQLVTRAGQVVPSGSGNVFSYPGPMIAANLIVMIGFVLLAVLAAAWDSVLLGAAALVGTLLAMLSQIVVAIVQVASPAQAFGLTPAEVRRAGARISSGMTWDFYVEVVLLAALLVVCALRVSQGAMRAESRPRAPASTPVTA